MNKNCSRYSERRPKLFASSFLVHDPVYQLRKKRKADKRFLEEKEISTTVAKIEPSINVRVDQTDKLITKIKYELPRTKAEERKALERRKKLENDLNFCKYEILRLPSPPEIEILEKQIKEQQPKIGEGKVMPIKEPTSSDLFPPPPKRKDLHLRKPKSGIFINLTKKVIRVYKPPPTPKPKKIEMQEEKASVKSDVKTDNIDQLFADFTSSMGTAMTWAMQEEDEEYYGEMEPSPYTRRLRRKVKQISRSTSFETMRTIEEEEEEDKPKPVMKTDKDFEKTDLPLLKQKDEKPKIVKKTKQPHLDSFYFGSKQGRKCETNNYGLAIPIAAYMFSLMLHPSKWTEETVDAILDYGRDFYDSLGIEDPAPRDLPKYFPIDNKKIKFVVSEPEVSGIVRSKDHRVLNLTKALRIFFTKHTAGILQTNSSNIAIWKDKYYYMYDYLPRNFELCPTPEGYATLGNFYNLDELLSILLEKSNLDNSPFIVYEINGFEIVDLNKDEDLGEEEGFKLTKDGKTAVILASWDAGDRYFGFGRNKQNLTMVIVALIYSKITPISAWTRYVVDKIMTIANRLHLNFTKVMETEDYFLKLDEFPSIFQLARYWIEIHIKANVALGPMESFSECFLFEFFECNRCGILEIDGLNIAIVKQRDLFFCFDPFQRNSDGLKERGGSACLSMHKNIESLRNLILGNFRDKSQIFRLHSLKYCTIQQAKLREICVKYNIQSPKELIVKKATQLVTQDNYMPLSAKCSITKIGPNVESLQIDFGKKFKPQWEFQKLDFIADLDSASLSETQIEPILPATPTEKDLEEEELGEEEEIVHDLGMMDEEDEEMVDEGDLEWYYATPAATQVGSHSLLGEMDEMIEEEEEVSPIRKEVLKANVYERPRPAPQIRAEDYLMDQDEMLDNQMEELQKPSNFMDLPDGSQILFGTKNLADFSEDLEFVAPFVSIMSAVIAKKFTISTWNQQIVDYILSCGFNLYNNAKTRFDQVSKMEIPLISLGNDDFSVDVEYFIDCNLKVKTLECNLKKILPDIAIFVTPTYACTIIEKNYLYYLFDSFANNEIGLGQGLDNKGIACVQRFKDLTPLILRIIHNKNQREIMKNREFNKFVLSYCHVKKLMEKDFDKLFKEMGEDENSVITIDVPKETKYSVGYQYIDGVYRIDGNKGVEVNADHPKYLGEDFFVCLIACLKLFNNQIIDWDTKMMDNVIEEGKNVHSYTKDLQFSKKQIVRNVLVDGYYFDVIVRRIEKFEYAKKIDFVLIQFPTKYNLFYKTSDKMYHRFDPTGEKANWIQVDNEDVENQVKYAKWFNYEITSFKKAPKKPFDPLVPQMKKEKIEQFDKPFFEEISWLNLDPLPWSPKIQPPTSKWYNWYQIYNNDLYVIYGNFHQISIGENKERNKQTLANLLVGIGMVKLYPLDQWSSILNDSILVLGNKFFSDVTNKIDETDYELSLDDFSGKTMEIKPYYFEFKYHPIVDGTMYLVHPKSFNLYKALRMFFMGRQHRFGIITVMIPPNLPHYHEHLHQDGKSKKKHLAFGKIQECEYFMFDCQSFCPPMFREGEGVAYVLRTTSLNRLLHVLVLTLRGGDFFIFDAHLEKTDGKTQNTEKNE